MSQLTIPDLSGKAVLITGASTGIIGRLLRSGDGPQRPLCGDDGTGGDTHFFSMYIVAQADTGII